jgi:hypothetical protein
MFVRKKVGEKENLLHTVERTYKRRGFTDAILERLRPRFVYSFGTYSSELESNELLSIKDLLPPEQFKERQNASPTLADFMEVAEKEPKALFMTYIVPKGRPDERVTVEGACVPQERKDLIDFLHKKALYPPDEEGPWHKIKATVGMHDGAYQAPEEYYCMWWD